MVRSLASITSLLVITFSTHAVAQRLSEPDGPGQISDTVLIEPLSTPVPVCAFVKTNLKMLVFERGGLVDSLFSEVMEGFNCISSMIEELNEKPHSKVVSRYMPRSSMGLGIWVNLLIDKIL